MSKQTKKSVEQKLYEAWTGNRGCRLTEEDIDDLLTLDDAIRTRITNRASAEAGLGELGGDDMGRGETWHQLKKRLLFETTE